MNDSAAMRETRSGGGGSAGECCVRGKISMCVCVLG